MLQVGKKLEKMSMRQLEDWKEQSEELEAETALRQTVTAGYLFQILNCHLIVCLRHDICQKIYATTVLEARILRKKCVNCNISQFATKERKCFKMS